jgi:hypothetical protein
MQDGGRIAGGQRIWERGVCHGCRTGLEWA